MIYGMDRSVEQIVDEILNRVDMNGIPGAGKAETSLIVGECG